MIKSKKKIIIETKNGDRYLISAHEVISDRATYYSERDHDCDFDEVYEETEAEDFEMTEWLSNNMEWDECKTLKKLPREEISPKDAFIESIEVVND
jgi:hypothetical protein